MAKDPDERYTTTVELAREARDAVTTPIPRPQPAPPPEPVWQQPADLNLTATPQGPPDRPPGPQPRPADRPGAWLTSRPPPQQPAAPPPGQPAPRRDRNRWLGLGVAALVVVAAFTGAGIYFGAKNSNRPAATSTATTTAQPATTTAQPAMFASFVGTWGNHTSKLVIDSNGTAVLTYADLRLCQSCSLADAPTGVTNFTLTSVSNGVASGGVSASSDTQSATVGDPVTAKLVAASPGELLQLTIGGQELLPFCNSISIGQCGA